MLRILNENGDGDGGGLPSQYINSISVDKQNKWNVNFNYCCVIILKESIYLLNPFRIKITLSIRNVLGICRGLVFAMSTLKFRNLFYFIYMNKYLYIYMIYMCMLHMLYMDILWT